MIDERDRVVAEKRLPNDLAKILAFLASWQAGLAGVAVITTAPCSLHSRTASRLNSSAKCLLVLLIPSSPDCISLADVSGRTGEGQYNAFLAQELGRSMPFPIVTAMVQDDVVEEECAAWVPWWSYTKTVLAAAALVLVSENRLRLDEPVVGRSFSVRHLLQHRSGLPDYGHFAAYHDAVEAGESPWPATKMLQRVHADKLLFEPGQGWAYSNIGYLLVRELIEDVTGMSIGQAVDLLIFAPLDIHDIRIANLPSDLDATAWGNPTRYHPGWVYHGLLVGTASAAALLLHRLLEGRLYAPSLLAAMVTPYAVGGPVPPRPWKTCGYGLGLMIGAGDPPGHYIGHSGAGPGSTAAVYQFEKEKRGRDVRRTAAAFAPVDGEETVERCAMALAHAK